VTGALSIQKRNPYVFVVGCPRSGTTLLQRMLDNHSELALANDTHFIPAAVGGFRPRPDLPLTPEMVERVREFRTRAGKGFDRLQLPDGALERAASTARTYPRFVSALYSELAAVHGKPWAGEKTPDYVRHLPLLASLFPWAKLVHLIRDGRDSTLALLDWAQPGKGPGRLKLWHESPVAACALWWQWQVSSGRRDAADMGSARYLEVRYESLVANPAEILRMITSFLELPYDEGMLAYHVGRTRAKPGLPSNKAWLPPTPGVRDWQTQMQPHDVELVEALVGGLLADLGYQRSFTKISPTVAREADRYCEWWARKQARREAQGTLRATTP
jgi:hypothetical protein